MGSQVTGSFTAVTGSEQAGAGEALAALTAAARQLEAYLAAPEAPHRALLADIGLRITEATEAVEGRRTAVDEVFREGMRHQAALRAGSRRLRAV